MNELEKQRILSDLSGQGRVYAIALLVLIVYVLIASGVVRLSPISPPDQSSRTLQPYSSPRAER